MSVDSMRVGSGRCSPCITITCLAFFIMMIYHYWSLSSTNNELLRQLDQLAEQERISLIQRDECITQREDFQVRLKSCQDLTRITRVQLLQVDESMTSCAKDLKDYKQMNVAKTDIIESLKIDKKVMSEQLEANQEVNKLLENKLNKTRDELNKIKLSIHEQKLIPLLPVVQLMDKLKSNNKTSTNTVLSNVQINGPLNEINAEPQEQNAPEKDTSNIRDDNAAEVNDGNNALASDLNLNFMSDVKLRETKK